MNQKVRQCEENDFNLNKSPVFSLSVYTEVHSCSLWVCVPAAAVSWLSLFSSPLLYSLATFFHFFWNSVAYRLPPAPQSCALCPIFVAFYSTRFNLRVLRKWFQIKKSPGFFLFLFTLKCTSAPSVCVCLCLSEILKISDVLEISEILKNSEFLKIFWISESFWSPKNFWKSGGKPSTDIKQDLNAHEDWKVSLTSQELHHSPSNDHAARGW